MSENVGAVWASEFIREFETCTSEEAKLNALEKLVRKISLEWSEIAVKAINRQVSAPIIIPGISMKRPDGEYFIDFNTEQEPGKIQAVRICIDLQTIADMRQPLRIDLCNHPLYKELKRYVQANP